MTVAALAAALLVFADVASDAARDALLFSAQTVIPSLFAFSVASSVLAAVGLPRFITRAFPLHRLLGLPECAAPALLCGLVGSMPVGAMLSSSLYDSGRITKNEAARLCAVSSNVSAAFLVGVVGQMFGSRIFGAILWAAQTVSAVACGVVFRYTSRSGADERKDVTAAAEEQGIFGVFCDCVTRSAFASVTVCGYIVFFRVVGAILTEMCPPIAAVVGLTLEFSSGAAYSARIGSAAACGFAVGLGGVSSFSQICNYAGKSGVPVRRTLLSKAVSAVVLALCGAAAERLTDTSACAAVWADVGVPLGYCAAVIVAAAVLFAVRKK